METEKFVSGYCRQLDGSRMVEAVLSDGQLEEIDCSYGNCLHQLHHLQFRLNFE